LKYLILPERQTVAVADASEAPEVRLLGLNLGGYFYDQIVDPRGRVKGIRYWMSERLIHTEILAFAKLAGDPRLHWDRERHYVDIFFDSSGADEFHEGKLVLNVTQDFSGVSAVAIGDDVGLCIALDINMNP
jgi:hypothetical protein